MIDKDKETRRKSSIKRETANWISHILPRNCLLKDWRKDRSNGKTRKRT
jgi:hypothetical protein